MSLYIIQTDYFNHLTTIYRFFLYVPNIIQMLGIHKPIPPQWNLHSSGQKERDREKGDSLREGV